LKKNIIHLKITFFFVIPENNADHWSLFNTLNIRIFLFEADKPGGDQLVKNAPLRIADLSHISQGSNE
jgi:hypothetical protein